MLVIGSSMFWIKKKLEIGDCYEKQISIMKYNTIKCHKQINMILIDLCDPEISS